MESLIPPAAQPARCEPLPYPPAESQAVLPVRRPTPAFRNFTTNDFASFGNAVLPLLSPLVVLHLSP